MFLTLLFMSTSPRRCSVQGMPCLLSLSALIEGIMGWYKSLLSSVKHFMDLNCYWNPDCDHFHVVHPLLARFIIISVELIKWFSFSYMNGGTEN